MRPVAYTCWTGDGPLGCSPYARAVRLKQLDGNEESGESDDTTRRQR